MKILATFVILLLTQPMGFASMVTVESYTDNAGYYWCTFSRGDEDRFYNLGSNGSGGIKLKIEGLTSITTPPDWSYTDTSGILDGWIQFNANDPLWLLETNIVTLGFSSMLTNSTIYDSNPWTAMTTNLPHLMGQIGGVIYDTEHNPVSGDSELFTFIGPLITPRPTTTSLVIVAANTVGDIHSITVSNGAPRYPVIIQQCTDLVKSNWRYVTIIETSNTNSINYGGDGHETSVFYRLYQ